MPHEALNSVRSIDDVVSYWEARIQSIVEVEEAQKQHFTVAHPPNVFIADKGMGAEFFEWRKQHGGTPGYYTDSETLDRLAVEDDDEYDDEEGGDVEEERKR